MADNSSINVDQLVDNVEKIHTLPTIYYRLDEAINNPSSSTSVIGEIISEDTGLSARLLKLANSAFFNFPSRVDTISMAVSIIGTRQIRDLALATSVINMFDGIPDDVINMQDFWKHSIACGVCSRSLGHLQNATNAETYFVAGLLHDVGSLAIYSQIPGAASKVLNYAREKQLSLTDVERKAFKADHATVGAKLLRRWKLPSHLVEAIQYHHTPSKAPIPNTLVDSVHIADIVATGMRYGNSGDLMVPVLDTNTLERTRTTENLLPKVVKSMNRQYKEFMEIVMDTNNG